MAVAPLVVTEPATSLPPPLNLNVSVVKVEPFIYIEKIAHTNGSIATSVAPLDGLVEFILNIVSEGGSSGPDAEPVIKFQVKLEAIALPAKSFAPVVIDAV